MVWNHVGLFYTQPNPGTWLKLMVCRDLNHLTDIVATASYLASTNILVFVFDCLAFKWSCWLFQRLRTAEQRNSTFTWKRTNLPFAQLWNYNEIVILNTRLCSYHHGNRFYYWDSWRFLGLISQLMIMMTMALKYVRSFRTCIL